jgi:hypothetical protein
MRWLVVAVTLLLACAPDAELATTTGGGGSGGSGAAGGAGGSGAAGGTGGSAGGAPQPGDALSAQRFGAPLAQRALTVDTAADGGYAIGLFADPSTLDFGGGPKTGQAFVARFDERGNHVWTAAANSNGGLVGVEAVSFGFGDELATALTFTGTLSGDYGVGASVPGDALIARHDLAGAVNPTATIGNPSFIRAQDVARLTDGRIVTCGLFSGMLTIAAGQSHDAGANQSIYVAVYNQALTPDCATSYGMTTVNSLWPACRLDVDATNGIHVMVNYDESVETESAVVAAVNGFDAFVGWLDPDCAEVEAVTIVGDDHDVVQAIAAGPSGDTFMTGRFRDDMSLGALENTDSATNMFVARFDPSHVADWVFQFGDAGIEDPTDVAVDSAGNTIVVGITEAGFDFGGHPLPLTGFRDGFVAKLNANGAVLWARSLHGTDSAASVLPRAVTIGPDDVITVVGTFDQEVVTEAGLLVSEGGADAFVVQLAP